MRRLRAAMRGDVRLQFRNGFYYAATFVAVLTIVVLSQIATAPTLRLLLPVIVLNNVLMDTFYFMSGLLLLEKGEGTLAGLVVTPLRREEYLLSKVLSLTLLGTIESVIVAGALLGARLNLPLLFIGLLLTGAFLGLCGFIVVIRYDSINSFMLPSIAVTTVISLPLLDYLDLWSSWLLYLHPVQPLLFLIKGAFYPLTGAQLSYGLAYGSLVVVAAFWWSRRSFHTFVVRQPGVRI